MTNTQDLFKRFLIGCIIGFLALMLNKLLSNVFNGEPMLVKFDWAFFIFIIIGGIAFILINPTKQQNR